MNKREKILIALVVGISLYSLVMTVGVLPLYEEISTLESTLEEKTLEYQSEIEDFLKDKNHLEMDELFLGPQF